MVNGTWEKEGHLWMFTNADTRAFEVPKEVTYTELVDFLYDKLKLDRFGFDKTRSLIHNRYNSAGSCRFEGQW